MKHSDKGQNRKNYVNLISSKQNTNFSQWTISKERTKLKIYVNVDQFQTEYQIQQKNLDQIWANSKHKSYPVSGAEGSLSGSTHLLAPSRPPPYLSRRGLNKQPLPAAQSNSGITYKARSSETFVDLLQYLLT
jgi:hypothetical protein